MLTWTALIWVRFFVYTESCIVYLGCIFNRWVFVVISCTLSWCSICWWFRLEVYFWWILKYFPLTWKKVLTNGKYGGNICELPLSGTNESESKRNLKRNEKSSWQMENDVLTYRSSLRARACKEQRLYLVNWITWRRTKNTLDNYELFKFRVKIEFKPTKILE